jgi:acyl carrier protein
VDTTSVEIRRFIVDNFLFGDADTPLDNDESLLDRGIIDSTGVLELVGFLEQTFGIQVLDSEITPEHLDSLDRLTRFVHAKEACSPLAR